jgi:hypothetical protein
VPEWGTHPDQLCGIDSEPVGEQANGQAATDAMDGERGAPIAANADQSVEWGVGGDVPESVPKVSTRNGGNARGTAAGSVTPRFLALVALTLAQRYADHFGMCSDCGSGLLERCH